MNRCIGESIPIGESISIRVSYQIKDRCIASFLYRGIDAFVLFLPVVPTRSIRFSPLFYSVLINWSFPCIVKPTEPVSLQPLSCSSPSASMTDGHTCRLMLITFILRFPHAHTCPKPSPLIKPGSKRKSATVPHSQPYIVLVSFAVSFVFRWDGRVPIIRAIRSLCPTPSQSK